jgi:hypothetical protein
MTGLRGGVEEIIRLAKVRPYFDACTARNWRRVDRDVSGSGTTTQESFVTSSLGVVYHDANAQFRVDKQFTLVLCCSQEVSTHDLVICLESKADHIWCSKCSGTGNWSPEV